MNFHFTNPQDDPKLYAKPPDGFAYQIDGSLRAIPNRKTTILPKWYKEDEKKVDSVQKASIRLI